jgi:hypothetical protein
METAGSQLDKFLENLQYWLVDMYDHVVEFQTSDAAFWRYAFVSSSLAILYFLVVKAVFGQYSTAFNIFVGMIVFQSVNNSKKSHILKQRKQLTQSGIQTKGNTGSVEINDDLSNEFDYSTTAKPTSFRKRGRPYRPRRNFTPAAPN